MKKVKMVRTCFCGESGCDGDFKPAPMKKKSKKQVYCVYVGKGEWPLFTWSNEQDAPSGELQASLMWHEKWHDDMRKVRITVEEL